MQPAEDIKQEHSIIRQLEKAKKEGANLLLPSTRLEGLSEFHSPVIDYVQLSPDPDHGDVYEDKQTKKLRITKQGLMKLSVCAGVIWHPHETRRVDNRQDRNYVAYQAVGGIRKTDGTPVFFKAEYDMDFEVIEEELEQQYRNKCRDWNKPQDQKDFYVRDNVRRDLIFKRKHKVKLCEAGAMNRVIRALLGLKNSYTKQELQKPFVTVRIVIKPDYNDKDVKRQVLEAAIKSMTGVYGAPSAAAFEEPPIDIPPEEFADANPESAPPEEAEEGPGEEMESDVVDFENSDQESQIEVLREMIRRKNYQYPGNQPPVEKLTARNRMNLFMKLRTLPDDDIPF